MSCPIFQQTSRHFISQRAEVMKGFHPFVLLSKAGPNSSTVSQAASVSCWQSVIHQHLRSHKFISLGHIWGKSWDWRSRNVAGPNEDAQTGRGAPRSRCEASSSWTRAARPHPNHTGTDWHQAHRVMNQPRPSPAHQLPRAIAEGTSTACSCSREDVWVTEMKGNRDSSVSAFAMFNKHVGKQDCCCLYRQLGLMSDVYSGLNVTALGLRLLAWTCRNETDHFTPMPTLIICPMTPLCTATVPINALLRSNCVHTNNQRNNDFSPLKTLLLPRVLISYKWFPCSPPTLRAHWMTPMAFDSSSELCILSCWGEI